VHGTTYQPSQTLQTQASGLIAQRRTLSHIGSEIAAAARVAAALHMAERAPTAQNPRDQAARLRDLVAAMSPSEAAK
jgi:hypothetical protein